MQVLVADDSSRALALDDLVCATFRAGLLETSHLEEPDIPLLRGVVAYHAPGQS